MHLKRELSGPTLSLFYNLTISNMFPLISGDDSRFEFFY